MDLISIVIPVYNLENYISKTIQNLIEQTYSNLEIVIVDDGSTDSSALICEELKKRDNRIKVIHQENSGVSSARNTGLKVASGHYITFVDGDDIVDKDMIQKLYNSIGENDLSICGLCYFDEKIKQKTNEIKIYSAVNALKELCSNNSISYSACAKLYKTDIARDIFFDIHTGILEDYLFVCNYMCKCKSVCVISDYLYFYVKRDTSALGKSYTHKRLEMIYAYKSSMNLIGSQFPEVLPYVICNYRVELMELYFRIPDGSEYVSDRQMINMELSNLNSQKVKGNLKKLIKILLFSISPNVYKMSISAYRRK